MTFDLQTFLYGVWAGVCFSIAIWGISIANKMEKSKKA